MNDLSQGSSRIELIETSGPVSPRHAYATTIVVVEAASGGAAHAVRDHRDASGTHRAERAIDADAFQGLLAKVLSSLPLGEPRDLVATKRDRKGISFNHVAVVVAGESTRLDYLLSDIDEDDGDPRARAVVEAIKHLF